MRVRSRGNSDLVDGTAGGNSVTCLYAWGNAVGLCS